MAFSARRLVTWIWLPVVLYVAWAVALFVGQRGMIFVGRSLPPPGEPAPGPAVEVWTLTTSTGDVEAWYHPPALASDAPRASPDPGDSPPSSSEASPASVPGSLPGATTAPAVLFAHGNGERIDDWAGAFQPLADRGVAVLLVEYPGYGRSEGPPTEETVTEALMLAYDRLAERPEVDPDRIVGLGRSLGGAAVAVLSRRRPLRALVLQSTFTSVRAFALRYLVPPFLVRDPFDALAAVRQFEGPVLVFHGRTDRVVPYAQGRRLAEAAPRGRLVTWPCGHNDCPPDWGVWLEELTGFLEEQEILR